MPRVRDTDAEEERSLESYRAMKSAEVGPELMKAIFAGALAGRLPGSRRPVCRRVWPEPVVGEPALSGAGPEGPGGVRKSISGGGELSGALNPWETGRQ